MEILEVSERNFLFIDNEMFLIGVSIKDLCKKNFGYTKKEESADELLKRLEEYNL